MQCVPLGSLLYHLNALSGTIPGVLRVIWEYNGHTAIIELADEVQLGKLNEWQKYVGVVFVEVKIKEGIVYDKHDCKVVGWLR